VPLDDAVVAFESHPDMTPRVRAKIPTNKTTLISKFLAVSQTRRW
jgi:hypothetical protein